MKIHLKKSVPILFLLGLATCSRWLQAEENTQGISAELATILSTSGGTALSFKLTNNSNTAIKSYPLGIASNRAVVKLPSGEVKEASITVDHLDLVEIKGHSSFTWRVNLDRKIGKYGFFYKQPGIYRVKWKVKGIDFDEVESNEILINNDGTTPSQDNQDKLEPKNENGAK